MYPERINQGSVAHSSSIKENLNIPNNSDESVPKGGECISTIPNDWGKGGHNDNVPLSELFQSDITPCENPMPDDCDLQDADIRSNPNLGQALKFKLQYGIKTVETIVSGVSGETQADIDQPPRHAYADLLSEPFHCDDNLQESDFLSCTDHGLAMKQNLQDGVTPVGVLASKKTSVSDGSVETLVTIDQNFSSPENYSASETSDPCWCFTLTDNDNQKYVSPAQVREME